MFYFALLLSLGIWTGLGSTWCHTKAGSLSAVVARHLILGSTIWMGPWTSVFFLVGLRSSYQWSAYSKVIDNIVCGTLHAWAKVTSGEPTCTGPFILTLADVPIQLPTDLLSSESDIQSIVLFLSTMLLLYPASSHCQADEKGLFQVTLCYTIHSFIFVLQSSLKPLSTETSAHTDVLHSFH